MMSAKAMSGGDDLARIHERLDVLLEKVGDVNETLAGLRGEHTTCRGQIGRLDATVNGNGSPGLVSRVAMLEAERSANAKSPRGDGLSVRNWLSVTKGFGALVTALGVALVGILQIVMLQRPKDDHVTPQTHAPAVESKDHRQPIEEPKRAQGPTR